MSNDYNLRESLKPPENDATLVEAIKTYEKLRSIRNTATTAVLQPDWARTEAVMRMEYELRTEVAKYCHELGITDHSSSDVLKHSPLTRPNGVRVEEGSQEHMSLYDLLYRVLSDEEPLTPPSDDLRWKISGFPSNRT